MKKLLLFIGLSCLVLSANAQKPLEAKVADLEQKIESITTQMNGLSQRLSEVEQLNIRLRKALDYGKPITSAKGQSGVTYNILSVQGNKVNKTLLIKIQVETPNPSNEVYLSYAFSKPSVIDITGERFEASTTKVGKSSALTIYQNVPVNGEIEFLNVDPNRLTDIKLLTIDATVDNQHEGLQFKNLQVDWK